MATKINNKTRELRAALDEVPLYELEAAINRRRRRVKQLSQTAEKAIQRECMCNSTRALDYLIWVSQQLEVEAKDLLSTRRVEPLTTKRHLAMAVGREVLDLSLQNLALLFGRPGKDCVGDHTAVIYAINRVGESAALSQQCAVLVGKFKTRNL